MTVTVRGQGRDGRSLLFKRQALLFHLPLVGDRYGIDEKMSSPVRARVFWSDKSLLIELADLPLPIPEERIAEILAAGWRQTEGA